AGKRKGNGKAATQCRFLPTRDSLPGRDEYDREPQRDQAMEEVAVEIAESDPERGEHGERHKRAPSDPGCCDGWSISNLSPGAPEPFDEEDDGKHDARRTQDRSEWRNGKALDRQALACETEFECPRECDLHIGKQGCDTRSMNKR